MIGIWQSHEGYGAAPKNVGSGSGKVMKVMELPQKCMIGIWQSHEGYGAAPKMYDRDLAKS